jgi:hypothetical protein
MIEFPTSGGYLVEHSRATTIIGSATVQRLARRRRA